MERNTPSPPGEARALLKVVQSQAEEDLLARIESGKGLAKSVPRTPNEQQAARLEAKFHAWDRDNQTVLEELFSTTAVLDEYNLREDFTFLNDPSDISRAHKDRIFECVHRLETIRDRLHGSRAVPAANRSKRKQVFIVHGHNDAIKYSVKDFLRKVTGAEPTILHEQADRGRTIIEKFEGHASTTGFAVILLTADDKGHAISSRKPNRRARQNVIFELGFFIGALGRRNVAILYERGVELPSDIIGLLYHPLDTNWQQDLGRDLLAAKIPVEMNRA